MNGIGGSGTTGSDAPTTELRVTEAVGDGTGAAAVRPFVGRGRSLSLPTESVDDGRPAAGVRAYTMTRGRAHATIHLEFETMLQATMLGADVAVAQRFERGDVLRLCRSEPLSVAELSARLCVPIGVVRVVAADLLTEGFLESFHPSTNVADDVLLITRLIAGVRAL